MIFFFKKKPIELLCISKSPPVLEYAPVKKANKFIPQWWKDTPSSIHSPGAIHKSPTMKHCSGFVDYYNAGLIIPLWCDLALRIGPRGTMEYEYHFSDKASSITSHAPQQHNNYYNQFEYQHLKINSPWAFFCKENIKFVVTEPTWSFIKFKTIRALPGILNYKYQSGTNINLMLHRENDYQDILIPFLEPMLHIIPISDRPLKLTLSDDIKQYSNVATKGYGSKFVNKYRANFLVQKENEK